MAAAIVVSRVGVAAAATQPPASDSSDAVAAEPGADGSAAASNVGWNADGYAYEQTTLPASP